MAHENGAPDAGLDALAGGNVTPSTMPTERAAPSERTPLAERIIALPPPISMEAFRTKVKVKVAPAAAIVVAKRSTGDDLTRIRGIDAMLAGRLAAIGVSRFAQIATWDQSDVQTISQLLDLGRTISRQNWIEQAALLQGPAKPSVIADAVTPPVETVDVRALLPTLTPRMTPMTAPLGQTVVVEPVVVAQIQQPPVVPVPEVPVSVVPVPFAPVPVVPTVLPRVVAVDSPGDAKFHQAVVHMGKAAVATPTLPTHDLAVPPVAERVPPVVPVPVVPVPVVPSQVALVPAVAVPRVMPRPVAAVIAAAPIPFQVPVPVVPELRVPELLVPELRVPEFSALAPQPLAPPTVPVMETVETVGARLANDDTLATQLHAAVAAAADDRAVAATVDLLSAFLPPPLAEEVTATKTTVGTTFLEATRTVADRGVDAGADVAFKRWVPPTPLAVPTPPVWAVPASVPLAVPALPAFTGGEAEAWSPMPSWSKPAPQVMPQSALAEPPASAGPASATAQDWTRPRDRWGSLDIVVPELPGIAPPPEPMAAAPLETVAPTMLDRLASLEAELTALAANDQPRAHAAVGPLAATAVPQLPYRSATAGLAVSTSDATSEQDRANGRRAGVRPDPTHRAAPTTSTALDGLDGGEADVMILPRGGDPLDIHAIASRSTMANGPSLGTLEQRMRRARPAPEVDVETYAGYHAAISEASVEIVRRDSHSRANVFADHGEAADQGDPRAREGSVRKFFKALKGDAN